MPYCPVLLRTSCTANSIPRLPPQTWTSTDPGTAAHGPTRGLPGRPKTGVRRSGRFLEAELHLFTHLLEGETARGRAEQRQSACAEGTDSRRITQHTNSF